MQNAAQQAEDERLELKNKVRSALPSLVRLFNAIDKDESGMITRDELRDVPMDDLPPKVLATIGVDNWEELFEYLDVDQTGTLSQAQEDLGKWIHSVGSQQVWYLYVFVHHI